MVQRKIGTLQKLIDAAAASHRGVKWEHVLEYLEDHCDPKDDDEPIEEVEFESPLPPDILPCQSLKAELVPDPVTGESLLRNVMHKIPPNICAALCQLGPSALKTTCPRGWLPLQYACRYPVNPQLESVMKILIKAYPESVVHRDPSGRTALHYLFVHHASARSPQIVKTFCSQSLEISSPNLDATDDDKRRNFPLQSLPKKGSAALIHDAIDGCLPLHYAIMNGARLQAINVLLSAYPESRHTTDRYGRTALHRYLGAGSLERGCRNVSGEVWTGDPWWKHKISKELVRTLASSRSTRTTDFFGRTPLHWACKFVAYSYFYDKHGMSIDVLRIVLESNIGQLTTVDDDGQTPLMIFFDSTAALQREESSLQDLKRVEGGPSRFVPSLSLLTLLLQHPDGDSSSANIAAMEDSVGRLPLHVAAECVSDPQTLELLLKYYPNALIHPSEVMNVPLHCAFTQFSAPRQTVHSIALLLQAYEAGNKGPIVDGRLGMKFEDLNGYYPLHHACKNGACLNVIELLVDRYPQAALVVGPNNDLPLHGILNDELVALACATNKNSGELSAPVKSNEEYRLASEKSSILIRPLATDVSKLQVADTRFGMLPLHIAVLFECVSYEELLRMLYIFPEAALRYSTHKLHCYTALDIHDMRQPYFTKGNEEWALTRELLFSFGPTLGSHRHRQGLLDRCVKLIISELNGSGMHHLIKGREHIENPPDLEITHTLSNLAAASDPGNRILIPNQLKRSNMTGGKSPRTIREMKEPDCVPKSSSIYDEETTKLGYDYDGTEPNGLNDDTSSTEGASRSDDEYFSSDDEQVDCYEEVVELPYQKRIANRNKKRRGVPTAEGPAANVESVFEQAKKKAEEETKSVGDHDSERRKEIGIYNAQSTSLHPSQRPHLMSEVALRLWTFFALFCDPGNPNDNYSKQVEEILESVDFAVAQTLSSLALPPFAEIYLPPKEPYLGLTYRDKANPKCRELIYKICYFLGKYEFDAEDDILLHRANDGSSVVVRAFEWIFTTEASTDAVRPGISEEQIWSTGERPPDVGATFQFYKLPVWMKFTKRESEYQGELRNRKLLGVPADGSSTSMIHGISPLLGHFSAHGSERKCDRTYKHDTSDDRFKSLVLYGTGKGNHVDKREIELKEYPFALVYPSSARGSLYDYFMEIGCLPLEEIRTLCRSLGNYLNKLHTRGFIHGNVNMKNIYKCGYNDEQQWGLFNVASMAQVINAPTYASISFDGSTSFAAVSTPPEMIAKLSPWELKMYNEYWKSVRNSFDVCLESIIDVPTIDPPTGSAYTVKWHYLDQSREPANLPQLPYSQMRMNVRNDLWAFGVLLFELLSGQPPFPMDMRGDSLLEFKAIYCWDLHAAERRICKDIDDLLAQDILLILLSPTDLNMTFDDILRHPFFNLSAPNPQKLQETRARKTAEIEREILDRMHKTYHESWLTNKSFQLNTWDFNVLERIHFCPSEMARSMRASKSLHNGPYSFIVLPFSLEESPDEATVFRLIEALCRLSKGCLYTRTLQKFWSRSTPEDRRNWVPSDHLESLHLNKHHFSEIQSEMNKQGSKHVEVYRHDPSKLALRMLCDQARCFMKCFESGNLFLFPVDEVSCSPVRNGRYPIPVSDNWRNRMVEHTFLSTYLCSLYARGTSGDFSGTASLFGYPEWPSAEYEPAKGLEYMLDDSSFKTEIRILEGVLSEITSTTHQIGDADLESVANFLNQHDSARVGMVKVSAGGASIWTTQEGYSKLQQDAKPISFKELLNRHREKVS